MALNLTAQRFQDMCFVPSWNHEKEDSMIEFSMVCVLRIGIKADLASEFPQLFFQQRSVAEQAMRFLPPKRLDVVGSFLYFGQNRL